MVGTLIKTEIYSLVSTATGDSLSVNATIEYYFSGPKKWVILTIPSFTLNNINFNTFKFEGSPSFTANESILKDEAITNASNYFINEVQIQPPNFILKAPPTPTPTSTSQPTESTSSSTDSDADLIKPSNVVEEYIAPEPQSEPIPTPQQVNDQTQIETNKKEEEQAVTDNIQPQPQNTKQNLPPTLDLPPKEKIVKTIKNKEKEIKKILIKTIISVLISVGARYIGSKLILPDVCAIKPVTDRAIKIRNQVVDKLNSITKILNTISLLLTGLTLAAAIFESTRKTLKTTRKTASLAIKFIPSPPGAPGAAVTTLQDLKDVEDETEINSYKITSALTTINLYLSALNATLLTIMSLLNQLDSYINECDPNADLISLSPTLITIQENNNQQSQSQNNIITYNNFILEIEEVPFSPTVNKRRAVAKNSQGIILIATPYSFTTLDDILLTELKLVIDANNLKAD